MRPLDGHADRRMDARTSQRQLNSNAAQPLQRLQLSQIHTATAMIDQNTVIKQNMPRVSVCKQRRSDYSEMCRYAPTRMQ